MIQQDINRVSFGIINEECVTSLNNYFSNKLKIISRIEWGANEPGSTGDGVEEL